MSHDRQRLVVNPFSSTAVAKVSDSTDMISVETPSTNESFEYLNAYLDQPADAGRRSGYVIALQGDYGSGKTHLALMLLNRVREWADEQPRRSARPVYLAANDSFLDLYQRFVKGLPEDEVYVKVREYFADTVAERIEDAEMAARVAARLRSPETDLDAVRTTFGLPESSLIGRLRERLADVTRDKSFANALSLLVRPGFQEYAWHWLTGGRPHAVLVERGIDRPIDETTAIEALGVFALLYGGQGHRFVLVVDELSNLVPSTSGPSATPRLKAFQELLEAFEAANGMLVLVGLNEALDLIVGGPRHRVSAFIDLSPFGQRATRRFIELSLARVRDWDDQLYPFDADAVREIVELTYGNPRQIGLYCRRLYQSAVRQGQRPAPITATHVRQVAREFFAPRRQPQVEVEVRAALDAQGWEYVHPHHLSGNPLSKVDYWIVAGSSGCALFLTGVVTTADEVDELTRRAVHVQQHFDCATLLVVSESVSPEHSGLLTVAFGREPLVYHQSTFSEDLTTLIKSLRYRLDRAAGGDALAALRDKVDRFAGSQARLQDTVEQLVTGLRELNTSTQRSLGELRRDFDSTRRSAHHQDDNLPARVVAVFDDRLYALSALDDLPERVGRLFTELANDQPAATATLGSITHVTGPDQQRRATAAVGVARMLHALVTNFRDAVIAWYQAVEPGRPLRAADQKRLEQLCESFDEVYENLPTNDLENGGLPSIGLRLFDSLGVDVRRAAIESFPR